MDAAEDELDIALHRMSADLIADFDRSLLPFLRKSSPASASHKPGSPRLRTRVRCRETTRLTASLLDPFQELPQLLDPHLPKWLAMLGDAFLESLQSEQRRQKPSRPIVSATSSSSSTTTQSQLIELLPTAICRILYAFCKIRGEKVVVRFLSVEPKWLELLLSALEEARRYDDNKLAATAATTKGQEDVAATQSVWTWEQRYTVLLWLSHLMFAPLDLSTISSVDLDYSELPRIEGFQWPENVPGIAARILPIAIDCLSSSGRERDAAKALLVRIAVRRDMQQLGVLSSLIHWAISSLRVRQHNPPDTPYHYVGVLSFLAGLLRSSVDTSDLDAFLPVISSVAQELAAGGSDPLTAPVMTSALVRKMLIKVMRSVTILILRGGRQPDMASQEAVEGAIEYFLEAAADGDTPVRLAASKALSIVALRLDLDMAAQVVEAVLEGLKKNVLWIDSVEGRVRDVGGVNPSEWHGLMLTLSHLLYRRSPPAELLYDIIEALLLGLAFERRSSSGGSVGTNVRDAACFGIWALARRYTTSELCDVQRSPPPVSDAATSILQTLATALATAASLDPAGNIRRGASAALQELIGRHPDTVDSGIAVVQVVDYHAVALRTRALQHVALGVTRLSGPAYGEALLNGLLGWRGIGDGDAGARRAAATALGSIVARLAGDDGDDEYSAVNRYDAAISRLKLKRQALEARQADELHGLLLATAAIVDQFVDHMRRRGAKAGGDEQGMWMKLACNISLDIISVLERCETTKYRRVELVAEAAGRLVVSSVPLLQLSLLDHNKSDDDGYAAPKRGQVMVSAENRADAITQLAAAVDSSRRSETMSRFITSLEAALKTWLTGVERETVTAASEASCILLAFSSAEERGQILQSWANAIRYRPGYASDARSTGYFFALAMGHPIAIAVAVAVAPGAANDANEGDIVLDALLGRWAVEKDTDVKVAIVQSLTQSGMLRTQAPAFLDMLHEGLNDYTTTARGDVGSHVRLETLRATASLWKDIVAAKEREARWLQKAVESLVLDVVRLAAEKLDRVRAEARATLALVLEASAAKSLLEVGLSSTAYFITLLSINQTAAFRSPIASWVLSRRRDWMSELLSGFVTSADTGNEDLVMASRAALCEFCQADGEGTVNVRAVCGALARNLKTRAGAGATLDRVVVPTLEVTAFLMRTGLWAGWKGELDAEGVERMSLRGLCAVVQRAGYKSGNIRKIEACVKVYGGIARLEQEEDAEESKRGGVDTGETKSGETVAADWAVKRREGVMEARRRLGALMFHPWAKVRSIVVDVLWGVLGDEQYAKEGEVGVKREKLKGMNWGRAGKADVKALVEELGLT